MQDPKPVLQHLVKRGAVDLKRYRAEAAYRQSMDELAESIARRKGSRYKQEVDLIVLESKSSGPQGLSFMLGNFIDTIDRLSNDWNWSELARIDLELTKLLKKCYGPITAVLRSTKVFCADKTWPLFALYGSSSLAIVPLASWILALYTRLVHGNNPGFANNPEFEDFIQGLISATLAFPLWLSNKTVKTRRKPLLNPKLLPGLVVLGVLLALEYLWFFAVFVAGSAPAADVFFSRIGQGLQSRWLYPLPFVVITANLLIFSRFSYRSEFLAEELHGGGELVGQFGFVAIAIIAIVFSAIVRMIFWLASYLL